jgi:hypothetical protein
MYDMNVKNTENMATQYIFPVRRKGNVTLDELNFKLWNTLPANQ